MPGYIFRYINTNYTNDTDNMQLPKEIKLYYDFEELNDFFKTSFTNEFRLKM